jgi:lipopolysaccharide export system ATP-binding protein
VKKNVQAGGTNLKVVSLKKTYQGRKVVEKVNLEVFSGEVVGLLGPNGAGKTTTFYLIVGLTAPNEGIVTLNGEEITHLPMYLRAQKGISYLPQEPSVFRRLSVEDNLHAIAETLDVSQEERERIVSELMDEFGIISLRRQPAFALSGGERRRLEIARSLITEPSFILLDEPFAGIDPLAVQEIQKLVRHLRDKNIGILITDHNVRETLKITDRAYIIRDGKIFRSGTPRELSADPEVRKVYLGENFRLD